MSNADADPKGIDLEALHGDVRKLVASFLSWGWADFEDILQDVFVRILERNGTPGKHDPSKGSMPGYVRMILRAVLSDRMRYRAALKRGGGLETSWEGDLDEVPAGPLWDPRIGERALYLRELRARPSCPPDVASYIQLLEWTQDSEDLQEALRMEVIQLRALRRRLTAWLRDEGELEAPPTLPSGEYSSYKVTSRPCRACGKPLLSYQKMFCSKACDLAVPSHPWSVDPNNSSEDQE